MRTVAHNLDLCYAHSRNTGSVKIINHGLTNPNRVLEIYGSAGLRGSGIVTRSGELDISQQSCLRSTYQLTMTSTTINLLCLLFFFFTRDLHLVR